MHSIAIFGDVRTHFIEARSTSRSSETGEQIITPIRSSFTSGVHLTSTAVVRALQAIGRKDLPKVYSYDTRDVQLGEATPVGDYHSWDLDLVPINGLADPRPVQRLRTSGSTSKLFDYPTLSPEFLAALRPKGLFEPR